MEMISSTTQCAQNLSVSSSKNGIVRIVMALFRLQLICIRLKDATKVGEIVIMILTFNGPAINCIKINEKVDAVLEEPRFFLNISTPFQIIYGKAY